jgi:hypothetical protein
MATTASVPAPSTGGVGQYKDIQPVRYNKEKELEGTGNFAAVTYPKYLPVWVSRDALCNVLPLAKASFDALTGQ